MSAEQDITGGRAGRARSAVGWFWRMFGGVVVALRYPILLAWIAAALAATLYADADGIRRHRRPDPGREGRS